MKEYIAYRGRVFQIEWYFTSYGKSQAFEYAESLSRSDKAKFGNLLRLMGDIGKIRDKAKFRSEGNQIFAFKPQPYRFLCFFFEGGKLIITNGFVKKQDKLPKKEKERALRNMKDYKQRVQEGKYYEKEN